VPDYTLLMAAREELLARRAALGEPPASLVPLSRPAAECRARYRRSTPSLVHLRSPEGASR
jgi:hypothetical protein